MVTTATPSKTKYVFSASAAPDECVKAAQVVIVAEFSWHVIAPAPYRMHCLLSFAPVPAVACPVVDVKGVQDDEGMAKLIRTCTDPSAGVLNLDGLLTGLEALGGKVCKTVNSNQLSVKETAAELSEARMEKKEKRGMRVTRPTRRVRVN